MLSQKLGYNYVVQLCFLVTAHMLTRATPVSQSGELRDYCQWETFNATCRPNEVILMKSAKYGRMQFGRCMKENHGSKGCYADVLPHLDRKCSGRNSCVLRIPDPALHNTNNCPKELMRYLQASYTCLKVRDSPRDTCQSTGVRRITSSSGYLSSVTDSDTGIGTARCPWQIEVDRGRYINLTMYSFSEYLDKNRQVAPCDVYVIIRDANGTAEFPACGGWHRQTALWVSHSNRIHMYIRHDTTDAGKVFLIRYEAIGCPDLVGLKNAIVRRTGDTAVVKCRHTGDTYFLSCVGSRWNGELHNCSQATALGVKKSSVNAPPFPYGLLIVIGLGVALGVAIGIVLLAVILVCWKKRKLEDTHSVGAPTLDPLLAGTGQDGDDTESRMYARSWLECPYGFVSTGRTRPDARCPEQLYVGSVEIPCALHAAAGSVPIELQQLSLHRLSSAAQYSPSCGAVHRRNSRGDSQQTPQQTPQHYQQQRESSTSFSTFKPPDDLPVETAGERTVEGIATSVDLLKDAMSEDDYRELNINTMSPESTYRSSLKRGYTLVKSNT